ncbi:MAG TPA: hypothetical protein VH987_07640 [Candidatus Limnocylindria bacterium]|jgi:hypothetical protein
MRRLTRLLLRLYPRAWMERYGDEFRQLLDDTPATPHAALDVARHGLSLQVRRAPGGALDLVASGGNTMHSHPQRSALLGALILLPTAILIGAALLKYVIGVPGPFDAIEPAMTPLVTHPLGETVFVLAPYLAILLALVPVVRSVPRWQHGRLEGTITVVAPAFNLALAAVSAAIAVFMAFYWVAENL